MSYTPATHAPPMWAHQEREFENTAHLREWALWWEQRTGKSRVIVDTAAYQYEQGIINAVVIGAYPSAVHVNWALNEFPAYLPERIQSKIVYWQSTKASRPAYQQDLQNLLNYKGLAILTFNCEALIASKPLWPYLQKFCHKRKVMFVADECFVAGTLVSTPNGDRPIENLKTGDYVDTPLGARRILNTSVKITHNLVKLKFSNGTEIVCTPEHPFMTSHGWIKAANLTEETVFDRISILQFLQRRIYIEQRQSKILQSEMRRYCPSREERSPFLYSMQKRVHSTISEEHAAILFEILFGKSKSFKTTSNCIEYRIQGQNISNVNGTSPDISRREDVDGRSAAEFKSEDEGNRTSSEDSWWERAWADGTAAEFAEYLGVSMDSGTPNPIGRKATWLSNLLQGRFSVDGRKISNRGRWKYPQRSESSRNRSEERYQITGVRVASVENIELACPVPVYNLHVEGDHRYYANGVLVHNCNWAATPKSKRTIRAEALARRAVTRRILTGTPADESPFDLFSMCNLLYRGILGFTSVTAFRNYYGEYENELDAEGNATLDENGDPLRTVHFTYITDPKTGRRIQREYHRQVGYRNLEDLNQRLLKIGSRVLRSECADLPPKLYRKARFELAPPTARAYAAIRDEYKHELQDGRIFHTTNALVRLGVLAMVARGYLPPQTTGEPCPHCEALGCEHCHDTGIIRAVTPRQLLTPLINPALTTLADEVEALNNAPAIVWCRYLWDVEDVVQTLTKLGRTVARYDGTIGQQQRVVTARAFQSGEINTIVATRAAARGIRLDRAEALIYYSQGFSLLDRSQSEDRGESLDSTKTNGTLIIDLIAENTVDDYIVDTLRAKKSIATEVMGDPEHRWL